jgi:DNA polymerase III subunit gamma/tau
MIGQEAAVTIMKAIIAKGRYESAYMFSGPSGTGKTTAGRIFAKTVLCENPQYNNPCEKCESCLFFVKDKHFGYRELDAASFGGKEDMVRLRDDAFLASVTKKKIILIDESHDISRQGQDALLKQVEQCPDHLIYIFCTTDPDKMASTLRNRCTEFQISKVDPELIAKRLKYICDCENFTYEEPALQSIALRSKGHVRNAVNLLEEVAYLEKITLENLDQVSRDFDEDLYTIISNLGVDLSKIITAYHKVSAYLPSIEFYNQLLAMITDGSNLVYGYSSKMAPKRMDLVSRLKDQHGRSLLEFMNYLITRDKFVDKIGIQSDLVVLHYKFSANNFVPKVPENPVPVEPQKNTDPQKESPKSPESKDSAPSSLSYSQLREMSILDRSAALRQMRRNSKSEQQEEPEIVHTDWPLPKEEIPGELKFEDEDLSPQDFSRILVGGRGGGI